MNENYKELIVKREMGAKEIALRAVCVIPTAFFFLISFIGGILPLILAVLFGVLTYVVWLMTDVEFEYLYLDKEISVDKVMAKSRRKKVAVFEVERMEILAPSGSHQLDSYNNRQVKKQDYSAGRDLPGLKQYAMYYDGGKKVLLNLSDDFVKLVKSVAPRKVFTD